MCLVAIKKDCILEKNGKNSGGQLSPLHIMADIDEKNEKNVPGKFYVDSNCIDCGLCREVAGDFFALDEDEGVSYVCKQPETDEEIELCTEAKDGCPVDSIGDDGE